MCADLSDLSKLADHVRNSDVFVLVQSRNVCSRPWCILELVTAIESNIPIVCLNLTSGIAAYDFAAASSMLRQLDTQLEHMLSPPTTECADRILNTSQTLIKLNFSNLSYF